MVEKEQEAYLARIDRIQVLFGQSFQLFVECKERTRFYEPYFWILPFLILLFVSVNLFPTKKILRTVKRDEKRRRVKTTHLNSFFYSVYECRHHAIVPEREKPSEALVEVGRKRLVLGDGEQSWS